MTMKVRIEHLEDGILIVTRVGAMGGSGNNSVAVAPGERYHGYKHRRLQRLGPGVHELKRKPPEEQADA